MTNLQGELYTQFDTDPAEVTAFMWWLTKVHGLPRQLDVLDVGCGPGRMLAEYARLGWNVKGIEPDPDFYEEAQQVATESYHVTVGQGGFQDITQENAYHLITAINDPFAYLLDIPARLEALGRLYRALKPGGILFLEVKNFLFKLYYDKPLKEEFGQVADRRVAHLMQQDIDFHHAHWICRDEYIVEGENRTVTKTHTLAIIPPPELIYFLEQTGFGPIHTYANYGSRACEPLNGRLILISAQKPFGSTNTYISPYHNGHRPYVESNVLG